MIGYLTDHKGKKKVNVIIEPSPTPHMQYFSPLVKSNDGQPRSRNSIQFTGNENELYAPFIQNAGNGKDYYQENTNGMQYTIGTGVVP